MIRFGVKSNRLSVVPEMNESRLEGLALEYLVRDNSIYQCTLCDKYGTNKDSMKMHLESLHFPTDGAYVCENCHLAFNTKRSFKHHKVSCKPF